MRGIVVKFFSVPLPVWLKHRCRNWQNYVLFLPCYISWAVPTICSSLIFLSVIPPFGCSFRYMCDTAHLLKSAGDHYGLSQWSQSLEGWNWDLLRQLLVQNGCLSFFFLKKKNPMIMHWRLSQWLLSLHTGCGLYVGRGNKAVSFFSFPPFCPMASLDTQFEFCFFSPEIRGLTHAVSLLGPTQLPVTVQPEAEIPGGDEDARVPV